MRYYRFLAGIGLAGMIVCGGCYQYQKAPASSYGDTYTQRTKDKADALLKGVKKLTLRNAQKLAIINNPTFISAYHAVNAARMRYYQAWGAYSPTLSANFNMDMTHTNYRRYDPGYDRRSSQTFSTQTGLQVNWLIFDGLAREFKLYAARHNYEYQRKLEEDEGRTLMRSVAYAYNTVLLAIEKRRIAYEDQSFQEKSLRDTEFKYQAGAVPLSNVLNFQIAVNNALVSQVEADYQYEMAVYALAVLMGYPEGTLPSEIEFDTDFKTQFQTLPAVDVYLDTALANRPDLKAYREQLEVSKYQLYQQYSSYSPSFSAYVNLGVGTSSAKYDYNKKDKAANDYYSRQYGETPSLSYGINGEWLLFNGLIRYNQIREYKANVASAEYQVAQQWLTVINEVRSAYANYQQSVKQTTLQKKTRDLSAKQRDLVDEEYVAGNTELTRLNEAQRDLVEAETNLASAYISVENAKAQLDAAVGVNPIAFYRDPEHNKPGELKYTPVPAKKDDAKKAVKKATSAAPAPKAAAPVAPKAAAPVAPKAAAPTPKVAAPAPKAAAPVAPKAAAPVAPKAAAPVNGITVPPADPTRK